MKTIMPAAATATLGSELSTGIPTIILVPLIMVIAIVTVVGIIWLYKKLNKNKGSQ